MNNKEKNFVSAVVYVHNSQDTAEEFLKNLTAFLQKNFENSEIICVNDCSTDDSAEIIKRSVNKESKICVTLLYTSFFHGVESAMTAGTDLSIGDYVFEFDNAYWDFSEDDILAIYKKSLSEGYDIVGAAPKRRSKLTSRLFYSMINKHIHAFGQIKSDTFRIVSRRALNRINVLNNRIVYRKAAYYNSGLKYGIIEYEPQKKQPYSSDRMEKKYRFALAIDSLILFTDVGYKFSLTMSALMLIAALVMFIYTVLVYILSSPVAGWTTTVLFLSVAFFGLFVILTVIIKYLQLLINITFKRQQYNFEKIEKLTK